MKQINLVYGENYNAGEKARRDVYTILKDIGIDEVICKCLYTDSKIGKLINEVKKFLFLEKLKKSKETYVLQYPFTNVTIVNKKVCEFSKNVDLIIIIHDIEGLRFEDSERLEIEKNTFINAKFVIVHNNKMKDFLNNKLGIPNEKLISLEIFDYLVPESQNEILPDKTLSHKPYNICYAGNLAKEKSSFLYQIKNHIFNYNLLLYGIGLSAELNDHMIYQGSFKSDDLPRKMKGDFGLIWDGDWNSADENTGFKNYTKFNNPHKLSLYIVSELPVIVWSKSAASEFVKKYNIGYVIESIDDINSLEISQEEYNECHNNIKEIKSRLTSGYFTRKAMEVALNDCAQNNK